MFHRTTTEDPAPGLENSTDVSGTAVAVVAVVLVVIITTIIGVILIAMVFILIRKRNGKNLLIQIIQF